MIRQRILTELSRLSRYKPKPLTSAVNEKVEISTCSVVIIPRGIIFVNNFGQNMEGVEVPRPANKQTRLHFNSLLATDHVCTNYTKID